jgi:ribosomal protein S18 acetylase RimI-like enzyme
VDPLFFRYNDGMSAVHGPSLRLRAASPEDALGAADLIYETMGTFGDYLFGQPGREESIRVVAALFRRPGHLLSFEHSTLAEADGGIVGIAQAFPGAELWKAALGLMRACIRCFGLRFALGLAWRGLPLASEPVAGADEYYVQTLAVSPSFRNRGIGRALLQNAQRQTAERGFPVCSLDVMLNNPDALRFYQREGFTIARKVESRLRAPGVQYAGFYRMRKRGYSDSSGEGARTPR